MRRHAFLLTLAAGILVRVGQDFTQAVLGQVATVPVAIAPAARPSMAAGWLVAALPSVALAVLTGALYPLLAADPRQGRRVLGVRGAAVAGLATMTVPVLRFVLWAARDPTSSARNLPFIVAMVTHLAPSTWMLLVLDAAGGASGALVWRAVETRRGAAAHRSARAQRRARQWAAPAVAGIALLVIAGVALKNRTGPLDHSTISELARDHPPPERVVSICAEALGDPEVVRRREAAVALSYAAWSWRPPGPTTDPASVPPGMRLAVRRSAGVDAQQERVAAALRDAIPSLRAAFADPDDTVRWHALWTVRWLGPEASSLTPDITSLLSRPLPDAIVEVGACALAAAGGPSAAEPLRALLAAHYQDGGVVQAILGAAAEAGPGGVSLLVQELSRDEQPLYRLWATRALARARPEDAAVALPTLEAIVSASGDTTLREAAVLALGHVLPRDEAIARFNRLVRQEDAPQAVCLAAARWEGANAREVALDPAICNARTPERYPPITYQADQVRLQRQCLQAAYPEAAITRSGPSFSVRWPDGAVEQVTVSATSGFTKATTVVAARFTGVGAVHLVPGRIALLKVTEHGLPLAERQLTLAPPRAVSAIREINIEPPVLEPPIRWPWLEVTYDADSGLSGPQVHAALIDGQTGTLLSDATPGVVRATERGLSRFVSVIDYRWRAPERVSLDDRARSWREGWWPSRPSTSDVPALITYDLRQARDPRRCETALNEIAGLRDWPTQSVPEILRFISEHGLLERHQGMCTFGALSIASRLGRRAAPLGPALAALADRSEDYLQLQAALTLMTVTGDKDRALRVVESQVREAPDPARAIESLARFPPADALPLLVEASQRGPGGSRRAAISTLLSLKAPGTAAPAVRALLSSPSYDDRAAGVGFIAALDAQEAVPTLTSLGRDESPTVRAAAIAALSRRGAVVALATLTGDPAPAVRKAAVLALLAQGPAALPALVSIAGDRSHGEDRILALRALSRQPANLQSAVPVLVAGLDDPDPETRVAAASALAALGPDRFPFPDIDRYLQHGTVDKPTRAEIVLSVLRSAVSLPPAALPLLEHLLAWEDAGVRKRAVDLARRLRPTAAQLVIFLQDQAELATDPDQRRTLQLLAKELGGR
jgi:HEAT repeat protein